MIYQNLLREMISHFEVYYQQVIHGDFSQVCAPEAYTPDYKIYDKYGNTRQKLCIYLFYYQKEIPEEILVKLFKAECQAIETHYDHEISMAIIILTNLLSEREKNQQYHALFDRARLVSFHTDYDDGVELFRKTVKQLSDFTIEECLELAFDVGEMEYALQFLEIFKSEHVIKNEADCRELIYWNRILGKDSENEPLWRKVLEFVLKEEQNQEKIIFTRYQLLDFLVRQEKFSEAYQEFEILSKLDLSSYYGKQLLSRILQTCLDLVNADIPESKAVWKLVKPLIKKQLKFPNQLWLSFYEKLLIASKKWNPLFAIKVQKQMQLKIQHENEFFKKINKISEKT